MKLRSPAHRHCRALRVVCIGSGLGWRVTPYLWGADRGDIALGPIGREVDVDSRISRRAGGRRVAPRRSSNDGHIVFGDLVWMALEPEDEIATIGGVAEAELDTTIIELGYARDRGSIRPRARVALLGLRYRDRSGARRRPRAKRQLGRRIWRLSQHARAWPELGPDDARQHRRWRRRSGIRLSDGLCSKLSGGNAFVGGLKLLDIDYEQDYVAEFRSCSIRRSSGLPSDSCSIRSIG